MEQRTQKELMKTNTVESMAQAVEADYEADVLIYFGGISRPWDDYVIDACKERRKRKNVLLMLTSYGGDAHAAYRIARCLRQNYHKPLDAAQGEEGQVIIFVNSVCASAGTLVTLAADRIILSDHAELGPLDVQLRKPDEVGERTSGLTPIQALKFLEGETTKFFRAQFNSLRFSRTLSFSTRMAADMAAELASGLLAKLYEQIDPLRLAEYDRTNRIAEQYGDRIKSKNVKPNAIPQLLEEYPSHEFCIDPIEAKELFVKVETPTENLETLGQFLKPVAQKALEADETAVFYLSEPPKPEAIIPNENEKTPKPEPNGGGEVAGDGKVGERPANQLPRSGSAKKHAAPT